MKLSAIYSYFRRQKCPKDYNMVVAPGDQKSAENPSIVFGWKINSFLNSPTTARVKMLIYFPKWVDCFWLVKTLSGMFRNGNSQTRQLTSTATFSWSASIVGGLKNPFLNSEDSKKNLWFTLRFFSEPSLLKRDYINDIALQSCDTCTIRCWEYTTQVPLFKGNIRVTHVTFLRFWAHS